MCAATYTLAGGSFTAPSGSLIIADNFTITAGTFTPNIGTAFFTKSNATQTVQMGGQSFYNVTHSSNGTVQLLTNNVSVANTLVSSTGTFNLNGLTLIGNGAATLSGGTFDNGFLTIAGTSGQTTNIANTIFTATVTVASGRMLVNNSTFYQTVTIQKTAGTADNNAGGNVFYSTLTIINSGTAALRMSDSLGDIYYGNVLLYSVGPGNITFGVSGG